GNLGRPAYQKLRPPGPAISSPQREVTPTTRLTASSYTGCFHSATEFEPGFPWSVPQKLVYNRGCTYDHPHHGDPPADDLCDVCSQSPAQRAIAPLALLWCGTFCRSKLAAGDVVAGACRATDGRRAIPADGRAPAGDVLLCVPWVRDE